LFSLILAVFMLICCLPMSALADSFVVAGEEFEYHINEEGTYTITDYDGENERVEIPSHIDGIPVTELGIYSLYNNFEITKIIIPETIRKIGECALTCNSNLTEVEVHEDNPYFCDVDGVVFTKDVTKLVYYPEGRGDITYALPETVTELGEYSFHSTNIENLTLPKNLKSLGYRAFYSSDKLKKVILPSGLEVIGDGAFAHCENLTEITIPDTVTKIESDAFYWCSSLTEIKIPDSVTEIGGTLFENCDKLETVYFGAGIEKFGDDLFRGRNSLTNITVASGNKLLSAEGGVLYNKEKTELIKYPVKKSTETYSLPDTVTTIQTGAFIDADFLERIELTDTLEYINEEAFYDCDKLESIYIGKSVKEIYNDSFDYCYSLKSVKVSEENAAFSSANGVLFNKDKTELIKYPAGLSMEGYTIPSSVRKVSYSAFDDQQGYYDILERDYEVYAGDCLLECMYSWEPVCVNVKTGTRIIGSAAFWADNVWGVSLPDEIRIICSEAFFACDNLQAVYIPEGVKYIGNYAFYVCNMLTDIYYGGTETQWKRIENIENINLPENATIHFESQGNEFVNPVLPEDMYDNTYVDEESGVSVSTDTDADLSVEDVKTQGVVDSVAELLPKSKVESVYEINLQREGEEVQPEDRVLVKIPAKNRFARVYRMEEDGTLTDMNAKYDGGYLWFYTDHFSYYALGAKQAEHYELGDVDMDENINVKDATAIQKYLASIQDYQPDAIELLMDFNKDGNVNIKDATAIQKRIAGIN
ncbi:MAG: leucine-rich repeat protein, partial [Ruminococcus sp.]|nr:leucine-rich repeat protein [Ruminococcus sp.]